jgi:hypothetical protein
MGIKSIAVTLLMYKSLLQLSSLPEISMCTSSKPRNSYKDLGFEAKNLQTSALGAPIPATQGQLGASKKPEIETN